MNNLIKDFVDFIDYFFKKRLIYGVSLAIVVLAGLGFWAFNVSFNNDMPFGFKSITFDYLNHGRFGSTVFASLGLIDMYVPIWSEIFTITILFVTVLLLCFLFHISTGGAIKPSSLFVFSLLFMSTPLNLEWLIYPTAANISIGFLLVAISSIIIYAWTERLVTNWAFTCASLLLGLGISIYEALATVYLSICFIIVLLRFLVENKNENHKNWKPLLGRLLAGLIIALILYVSVNGMLMAIGFEDSGPSNGAAKEIAWFATDLGIFGYATRLIVRLLYDYVYNAFFYFSILVFVVSCYLLVWIVLKQRSHRWTVFSLGVLLLGSNFVIAVLQGVTLPYRAAQSIPLFVGFVWMIFWQFSKRRKLLLGFIIGWTVLIQTKELSMWAYYDYEMSQKNIANIQKIGFDIKQEFGEHPDKPLYVFGGHAWNRTEDFPRTRPLILFKEMPQLHYINQHAGVTYFGTESLQFPPLFKEITGLDVLSVGTDEESEYATLILENNQKAWPQINYIKEFPEFILVNLGGVPQNTNVKKSIASQKIFIENLKKLGIEDLK